MGGESFITGKRFCIAIIFETASIMEVIDREEERKAVERMLKGEVRGIVFTGERGVGKTTLLRVARDMCERQGYTVVCYDPEGPCEALEPVITALSDKLGCEDLWDCLEKLAVTAGREDLLPEIKGLRRAGSEAMLFHVLSEALAPLRVVIAVDDMEYLDAMTSNLMQYILRRGAAMVIGALYEGACPDHVRDAIRRAEREGLIEICKLGPLEKRAVVDHLISLGYQPYEAVEMYMRTKGHPLLLTLELHGVDVEEGVEATMLRAFNALSHETRAVLQVIGVFGEWATLNELERFFPDEQIFTAVEEGGREMIVRERGEIISFTHPAWREVIDRTLVGEERRLIYRKVAHILEEMGRHYQAAVCCEVAGDRECAAENYIAAGKRAYAIYGVEDAEMCFVKAMRLSERGDVVRDAMTYLLDMYKSQGALDRAREVVEEGRGKLHGPFLHEILLLWADFLLLFSRNSEARDILEQCLMEMPSLRRASLDLRFSTYYILLGEVDRAGEYLDRIEGALGIMYPEEVARYHRNRGILRFYRGDLRGALEEWGRARDIYSELHSWSDYLHVLNNIGITLHILNRKGEAIGVFTEAENIARLINASSILADIYNNLGTIYEEMNDLDRAHDYYSMGYRIMERAGDTRGMAVSLVNLGNNSYYRGRYRMAEKFYRRAHKISKDMGFPEGMVLAHIGLAHVFMKMPGREGTVVYHLQRAMEIAQRSGNRARYAEALLQYAVYLGRRGELGRAGDLVKELSREEVDGMQSTTRILYRRALAYARMGEGDVEGARRALIEAMELAQSYGDSISIDDVEEDLGFLFHE